MSVFLAETNIELGPHLKIESLTPPSEYKPDRQISWQRPPLFAKYPCGAVFTVGSYSESADALIPYVARQHYWLNAEGGILGAPELPQKESPNGDRLEDMTVKPIYGDRSLGIYGIPHVKTRVKLKEDGTPVVLVSISSLNSITSDGNLVWDTRTYPKVQENWNNLKQNVEEDYASILLDSEHIKPLNDLQIETILASYRIPPEASPGFYQLLEDLEEIGENKPNAIKLQLASPATILSKITDNQNSKNINTSSEMVDFVRKLVALRNRAMVVQVRKKWNGRIIVSTDNPIAANLPTVTLKDDINEAFALVKGLDNVVLTMHSCGALTPDKYTILEETPLHAMHLDLFNGPTQIANNSLISNFIEKDGHFIAAGIVPTDQFARFMNGLVYEGEAFDEKKHTDIEWVNMLISQPGLYKKALVDLYKRLEKIVADIQRVPGLDNETVIWAKMAVSSSCGQGGDINPEVGKVVFHLMRDLSYLVRALKLDINYGIPKDKIRKSMDLLET